LRLLYSDEGVARSDARSTFMIHQTLYICDQDA